MNEWLAFWRILLIVAFALFSGLAIVVTIGGFFDVRALFRSVDARHHAGRHGPDVEP